MSSQGLVTTAEKYTHHLPRTFLYWLYPTPALPNPKIMATASTVSNSADDILLFGQYYQTIASIAPQVVGHGMHLSAEESSLIHEIVAHDENATAVACAKRLDLGIDYYYTIKHRINSLVRVWDAIIEQKLCYDAAGWPPKTREFINSFQLCFELISRRVSVGLVGCSGAISCPEGHTSDSSKKKVVNSPGWTQPDIRGLGHQTHTNLGYCPGGLVVSPPSSSLGEVSPSENTDIIPIIGGDDSSFSAYGNGDITRGSDQGDTLQRLVGGDYESKSEKGSLHMDAYQTEIRNDAELETLLRGQLETGAKNWDDHLPRLKLKDMRSKKRKLSSSSVRLGDRGNILANKRSRP